MTTEEAAFLVPGQVVLTEDGPCLVEEVQVVVDITLQKIDSHAHKARHPGFTGWKTAPVFVVRHGTEANSAGFHDIVPLVPRTSPHATC